MKKLQQFYTLKFSSERLKKSNYNINISLDNARINQEVITINNSELIRALFRYKHIEFNQNELDNLLKLQRRLKKEENTSENREKLLNITKKIESVLFLDDLVSIEFTNKAHYLTILKKKGFYVNGTRYVPFMATAGMIRRNTALFINNNIRHPLMDILENGRDEKVELVPAKFGAYFSLYCSSTLPVSFPKFAVIADKEIETVKMVDFVTYKGEGVDDDVTSLNYNLKLNAWDGQGLISPRLAEQWSNELELGYTFSCGIIRAPFLKGLAVVFDFHKFATDVAKTYKFTDIYGEEQDIREIDLIVSESMFKLSSSYKSTADYVEKCEKNGLGFAIAKVNPKHDNSYSRTGYQFLQILNLTDADIARLCEPTLDWIRDIGTDPIKMLLYATGENNFKPEDFNRMDISVKAILVNPMLAKDKYIQERFKKTIEKKKRESYMGSVLINANYQFMIGDPYYQACHLFGVDSEPLLKEEEHYSEYWLERGVKKVAAIRSPAVHHSELNVLTLQNRKDTREWYKHIHSGIIFPANGIGVDCAIHGGADFDGDLVCTINNKVMIGGKIESQPIIYESQKAEKVIVDSRNDKQQVESQLNGHNSKVGFATNISSSLYTLLEEFPVGSKERETILKRLKIGRVIQGEIIDGVKGLKVPPFRNHWVKWKKITPEMSNEEQEITKFNNSILCEIRPAYFRFLYPHYMSRYNKELKKYNTYTLLNFGKPFKEMCDRLYQTEEELVIIKSHKRHSYFLDNKSVVNRTSEYMRKMISRIEKYVDKDSSIFDYHILTKDGVELDETKLNIMRSIIDEYKSFKQGIRHDIPNSIDNIESFLAYLRKKCILEVSSNEEELVNYAVALTYENNNSDIAFVWKMFPDGILTNIMAKSDGKIVFPMADPEGDIEYLWSHYSLKQYDIEELYEK